MYNPTIKILLRRKSIHQLLKFYLEEKVFIII